MSLGMRKAPERLKTATQAAIAAGAGAYVVATNPTSSAAAQPIKQLWLLNNTDALIAINFRNPGGSLTVTDAGPSTVPLDHLILPPGGFFLDDTDSNRTDRTGIYEWSIGLQIYVRYVGAAPTGAGGDFYATFFYAVEGDNS